MRIRIEDTGALFGALFCFSCDPWCVASAARILSIHEDDNIRRQITVFAAQLQIKVCLTRMLFETVWRAQTQSLLYLFALKWTKQVFVCHINFSDMTW